MVVTIADNDDGLQGALKSLRANALFRGGKKPQFNANLQPVRSIQAPSTDVPDRWIGFDCTDLVVLGDFVHTSLAPKQLDAIKGWVQGGGNLVVVGGNNAARLNASPLARIVADSTVELGARKCRGSPKIGDALCAQPAKWRR